MAFSSSTTVKTHLKISGTTYDSLLTQLCTQVDAFITKETGVPTAAGADVTYTNQIVDSSGELYIRTKYHPITSLAKIEAKQSDGSWLEYTLETIGSVDFADDRIYPRYVVACEGRRNIRLTYDAGYATADVPTDLQLAAILIVATLFNTRNNVGFNSLNTLGLSQSLSKEDYIYVTKILTKYKSVYAI